MQRTFSQAAPTRQDAPPSRYRPVTSARPGVRISRLRRGEAAVPAGAVLASDDQLSGRDDPASRLLRLASTGCDAMRSLLWCLRYWPRDKLGDPPDAWRGGSLPDMTDAHEVVAAYWAAAEARDWDAFGALLADDVIYHGPQTREQVRGRDAYIRFNVEGFTYDWHITVQQIVGEGQHAASWIEFTGQQGTQPGLCFFDLADDGKIARITDFWPDPYELPASRAHLVERY
jgi:ketosteroid isomerase-like protein